MSPQPAHDARWDEPTRGDSADTSADFHHREPPLTLTPEQTALMHDIAELARAHGERWTNQRVLVVIVLLRAGSHLEADDILRLARALDPAISQTTVYRTLKLLTVLGVVDQLMLGGTRSTYEMHLGKRHHDHLIDVETGETLEFLDPELERLQEEIAQRLGYTLTTHRLVLMGRKTAPPTPPAPSAET